MVVDVQLVQGILGLVLLEVAREDAAASFRGERFHSGVVRRQRCESGWRERCGCAGVLRAFEQVGSADAMEHRGC